MSSLLSACKRLVLSGLLMGSAASLRAADGLAPQGGEYPPAGQLRGDQVMPSVSLGASGGYLVWQDNATDGDGLGISARRLGPNLLGNLSPFRINEQGAGDQENARVQVLKDGGAVVVWQGGNQGAQDIFARFIGAHGTFTTGDVRVNSFVEGPQANPAVAVLSSGQVVVTWASFGQDGSFQGVYAQVLSSAGTPSGGEFRVNQTTRFNQRTPSVVALANDEFVIAWVSEQERFEESVDIFGRVFNSTRGAVTDQFLINGANHLCANPALTIGPDGGFLAAWSQRDLSSADNAWDVVARAFNHGGSAISEVAQINTHQPGNHYGPQVATLGDNNLIVWTSLGQDGSLEGIFGRFVDAGATASGTEFQVNTWAGNRQFHPAVAADGSGQFLAVWSSFVGGSTSFDLLAQRYAGTPIKPGAPFVSALSSTRLSVTWPSAGANTVAAYELYVDGAAEPLVVDGSSATVGSLVPGSSHSFKLAYRFVGGGRSAVSEPVLGVTWGSDENLDGLPDDWQTRHWGADSSRWPDPKDDSDGDGAGNLQEFLAGTDPTSASSVLRMQIRSTAQGSFLTWNTQAGLIYQLQACADLNGTWENVGTPRFAAASTDSLLLDAGSQTLYYRLKRVR